MSDESNSPSGGNQDPSGNPDETNSNSDDGGKPEGDYVKRSAYQKSLTQEKNARERAKKAEAELAELKAKQEQAEQERLEANQEWETRAKQEKERADKAEAERNAILGDLVDHSKREAVLKHLGGNLKHPDYANFIDLDSVEYDSESGVNMDSAQQVANNFLANHKHLLDVPSAGKLPGGKAEPGGAGKITHAEWLKLPLAEKKKRMRDVQG